MTIAALVARAPLRMGAKGDAVLQVQAALIAAGHTLLLDGDFGVQTREAVRAFDAARGLPPDGIVDAATAAALDAVAPPASVVRVAPWLSTARALTGTKEAPGAKDNPLIVDMAHEIVRRFPELRRNVDWYNHDSIPWCGLFIGYCFAVNGIRPADAPLSALAWATWGQKLKVPTPGALLVFKRAGGGHVTFYESEKGKTLYCRGGNQNDMVNVSKRSDQPIAIRWPPGIPLPTSGRKIGVTGNAVAAGKEV